MSATTPFLRRFAKCAAVALLLSHSAIAAPGDVDPDFTGSAYGAASISVLPDGKTLVSHQVTSTPALIRLLQNGSKDPTFNATINTRLRCIAVQPDGRILVGGDFTSISGTSRKYLARLFPDGSVDHSFDAVLDGAVNTIAILPDGGVVVGGAFTQVSGQTCQRIAKLSANGVPAVFPVALDNECTALHLQPDGNILVGGFFTTVSGTTRGKLARVSAAGVLDQTFVPNPAGGVTEIMRQPDGKFVVTHATNINRSGSGMLRIDATTGATDASFQSGLPAGSIYSAYAQADGKILVAGFFSVSSTNYIGYRLEANGALDATFPALRGPAGTGTCIAPAVNGKLLIAGAFGSISSIVRNGIARISTDPVTTALVAPSETSLEWQRSATSPDPARVTFESRTQGGAWTFLGHGQRISGGWGLDGVTLPVNGVVRARAYFPSTVGTSAHEEYLSRGTAQPGLSVSLGSSSIPADGTLPIGNVFSDLTYTYDFHLTNTGDRTLEQITIPQISGATIEVPPPASLSPGESAIVRVKTAQLTAGPYEISFAVHSNLAAHPAYAVRITGTSSSVLSPVYHSPSDVALTPIGSMPAGHSLGQLTLGFAPAPGTVLKVVTRPFNGVFLQDLPDGAIVSADFNGVTYRFVAGYYGGPAWNDLTLTLLGDGVIEKNHQFVTSGQFTIGALAAHGDGTTLQNVYRWDATGAQDASYKNASTIQNTLILPLADGSSYQVKASGTNRLTKHLHDGSIDPTFNATVPARVAAMVVQPDGKLIIAGDFTQVSGTTRNGLARLLPDGTVDPAFSSTLTLNLKVKALALQTNGKLLVGGTAFTTTSGGTQTGIARLHADGTRDSSLDIVHTGATQLLVQPDGKILIVSETATNPSATVLRYLADGTPDTTFSLAANDAVKSLALQADGKFLLTGAFTRIGGHACRSIARIHPDGTPDATFSGDLFKAPAQMLIDGKNRIQIAGSHAIANGVDSPVMASLANPTAASQVEQTSPTTIRWMRQGGAADLQWVNAEIIPQGGSPASLSQAQRIAGGWEITSPNPISNATVRLSGPTIHSAGMSALVEAVLEIGTVTPQVVVKQGGQVLPNGTLLDLGAALAGNVRPVSLSLENPGAGTLEAPVISVEGTHAADFSLTQPSATDLTSGGQRSFLLNIHTLVGGVRTAQLVVRSADLSVAPYVIPLQVGSSNEINPVFNSATDIGLTVPSFNPELMDIGTITLGFAPAPGTTLTLVSNTGTTTTPGKFLGRTQRPYISAVHNGVTYWFATEYTGNDIYLRLLRVGDPVPGFFVSAENGTQYAPVGFGMTLQPDGKALVSGSFQTIGGKARPLIARLHPDGTVDESFSANINAAGECILVLDDGRIVIDGYFYDPDGDKHDTIYCLNPDGSRVESFKPDLYTGENQYAMANRLLQLKSGKILIGGRFHFVDGMPRKHVALLNPDGSLDQSFNANLEGQAPNIGQIYSLAEQADGKILVGGSFGSVGGATRYCLARLNADGTLDTGFNPILGPNTTSTTPDPFGTRISSIAQLPNGKILIGGEFSTVNGKNKSRVALLNGDGTLDETFTIATVSQPVTSFAVQEDGTILMAGPFGFRRLLPTGQTASGYTPNVTNGGNVNGLALDHEGNLWMTGTFTIPGGWPSQPIVKLQYLPGAMDFRIENGNTAFWEVSGTAPALRDVKFEVSTDGGAAWTSLGAATKVTGGWSLANLTLPTNGFIRAKGDAIITNRGGANLEETILFGRPPTAIEEWRMERFGSFTNQRDGADLADADNDGVKNLMEYAFNLDPQDSNSAQVPAWTNDSSQFEINFTPPANVEGVSYGVEWSSTMNPSDWQDVTNQGTGGNHHYVVPKDATLKFMRVKVTNTGSLPPP